MIRDPNSLKVINFKLGDGISKFSELEFQSVSKYPYADPVTNPIGDLELYSNQSDRLVIDIIKDMISPFQASSVSNVRTNAEGTPKTTAQLEVGQAISSEISVTYDVDHQVNLVSIPTEIDSFGFFNESNPYPLGSVAITPLVPLAPTQPQIYTIRVRVNHTEGASSWVSAYMRFDMRFIWGTSTLSNLTTSQHAIDLIASGGGQAVLPDWRHTYETSTGGYSYVLIPSILLNAIPAPIWTEVSDPNAPASIEMVNMGTLSVNNGIATYNYEKYRSPFLNLSGGKFKAS